uniref:Secreted protein n=1 Tax=Arundo donax TaxID=35708 RepID=A0A0A9F998_ARUDO
MKFSSTRTLLVLKSLWINGGAMLCKWFRPLAAPMAIESLCLNSSLVIDSLPVSYKWRQTLPLGRYSNTSICRPPSWQ